MLTTLAAVKTQMGIPASDVSFDGFISQLLPQADRLIKSWCMQELEAGAYVEYHDGRGRDRIILRQRPVTSLVNVWLDPQGWYGETGSFDSTTLLVNGADYVLVPDMPDGVSAKGGVLQRIRTVWPAQREVVWGLNYVGLTASRGTVKVAYNAGYSPVPYDLAWCASVAVALMVDTRRGTQKASESHEDYSYSLVSPKEAADVLGAIKPYLSKYRIPRYSGGV